MTDAEKIKVLSAAHRKIAAQSEKFAGVARGVENSIICVRPLTVLGDLARDALATVEDPA
jgi:hypothetical protein